MTATPSAGGAAVISTDALTKRYAGTTVVDDVALDVREGDVYGFLGANGSGKTTTIRMLLGLVLPTSGTAEVLGSPMPSSAATVLPRVGALVEGPGAWPHLSGRRNLVAFDAAGGSRVGRSRITAVLEQVGLDPTDRRPVRTYSLGMRQRLGLGAALLRDPALLVLDEPTNGLDPQGIHEIRTLLLDLARGGTTVLVSSHLLAEIEQMCTRVGVLASGRLVLQDDLATLTAPTGRVVLRTSEPARALEVLGRDATQEGEAVVVPGDSASVNARLVGAGVPVAEIGPLRRTLEQVVLEATSGGPGTIR